jgi:predicted lysophospholipase L1 biosynthesis ABC-type transport system permease subunit
MCSASTFIDLAEQVQESPVVEPVGSAVSSNVVMAGIAMMFMMGTLLAVALRKRQQYQPMCGEDLEEPME